MFQKVKGSRGRPFDTVHLCHFKGLKVKMGSNQEILNMHSEEGYLRANVILHQFNDYEAKLTLFKVQHKANITVNPKI